MKKINAETGYWKPSPGTIYPLLEKLQSRGLVTSRIDGKKKLYLLTSKAKVFLKITDAKKAAMAKYALCCLKTYKFLFGDDVMLPVEEDKYQHYFLPEFSPEAIEFHNAMILAAGQKDPKKVECIKKILHRTSAEIKRING